MKKPFVVGERVAVYIAGTRSVGRVLALLEFGNLKIKCKPGEAYGYRIVHPKQCRRLVRKERRVIWISKEALGRLARDGGARTEVVSALRVIASDVRFIEVRKK